MKTKNILLTTALLVCTQLIMAQTIITTNPPRIDVDSNPHTMEFELVMEGDPLPWTATIEGDWVTVEPLSGEGSASIFLHIDENLNPRRTGRILIEATDGEAESYILEIRQHQAMPSLMMPIDFSILHFTRIDQLCLPYTARASFNYPPIDTMLFFSLIARRDEGSDPAWLVRNIPFPEARWHDSIQPISARFDLGLLGYDQGEPVEMLEYSYTLSYEPDTIMPWVPESSFRQKQVLHSIQDAIGRILEDILIPDTVKTYFTPDFMLPFEITDKYYVGCEMVNGDLDSTKYKLDDNGCGPAAATNSLKWLMKKHDNINLPGTWHDGFKQIAALMEQRGKGVNDKDFIRGKLDIIEAYNLPIKVKYQDNHYQGDIKSTSGNSSAECHDATNTSYPAKDWMFKELKDKEDVEVGFTYPDGKGHWVVLTGTHSVNGRSGIFYKHDAKQRATDAAEVKQEHSWIKEDGDTMKLANEGNAVVDIVVSESFDPDYQPEPDSESFNKYCKSFKRTIAPGGSIEVSYPENDKRCFNTTVRVLNRHDSNSYKKEAEWNFNSGKTRKYKNNTGKVVTVEFHNDDMYDGGLPLFKSYEAYEVGILKIADDTLGISDPDNSEEYGGLSIGTDDDSYEEFGDLTGPEAIYVDSIGAALHDFPKNLNSNGVKKISIQKEINVLSRYWHDLGLVIGIDSIEQPGHMTISCANTGFSQTLEFVDAGEFVFHLGSVTGAGTFELQIELEDEGSYFFDNIGIPSLVQIEPILEISKLNIDLDTYLPTSDTVEITNSGGTDLLWYVTEDAGWITIDPINGINDATLIISCTENTSDEERTAELVVTGPNARNSPQTIIVTQPRSTASIGEIDEPEFSLNIFPNPNDGVFDIRLQGLEPGKLKIKLSSVLGKEVWSYETYNNSSEWIHKVQPGNYTSGIYFLIIESNQGRLRKMVILRK